MKSRKQLVLLLVIIFLLSLPFISALSTRLPASVNNIFRALFLYLRNDYFVYALDFILFFILFYAIYSAAATRISIFGNKGGGLNKQGKLLGIAIAGITNLGIFYFARGGVKAILQQTLTPFGVFGGLMLGLIVFMIVYFGFKEEAGGHGWKIGLAAAALAMIIAGAYLSQPNIMALGWAIAIIAAIIALISAIAGAVKGGGGGGGGGGGPGGGGGGRGGRGEEEMGPPKRRYRQPNLVPHITLCTDPATYQPAPPAAPTTAKIQVRWNVPDPIMTSERIAGFQVRLEPGRFWKSPIWTRLRRQPFYRTHPHVTWFKRKRYTTDRSPFVIPFDLPIGQEYAVTVKAYNTAGFGPRSEKVRITVGQNICDQVSGPGPSEEWYPQIEGVDLSNGKMQGRVVEITK